MSAKTSHRRSLILHLLFPTSSPRVTPSLLAKYLSTTSGLDKSLMLIQYPSRIVIPLLLYLAQRTSRKDLRTKMIRFSQDLTGISGLLSDARTVMRLLGQLLLPFLWLSDRASLTSPYVPYPNPGLISLLPSLPSLLQPTPSKTSPTTHLIDQFQTLSLLLYYPLENLSFLSSKNIFPLGAKRELKWSVWSCRFWMIYVALEFWRLARVRKDLSLEEERLRTSSSSSGEEKIQDLDSLKSSKTRWKEQFISNLGYAPLTVHWSLYSGAWENQAWTGLFGTIACIAGIRGGWKSLGPV